MAKQDCPGAHPLATEGEEVQRRVGLSRVALNVFKLFQVQKANVLFVQQ